MEAVCLPHGGNLAVLGLIDFGRIQSGQKVLINGGCSGTGAWAIQIAKLFDVEVTGVDRTEKLDMMHTISPQRHQYFCFFSFSYPCLP